MLKPEDFFNIDNPIFNKLFGGLEYVWEGLKNIPSYIKENINPNVGEILSDIPMIAKTRKLENGALIYAGSYIMADNIEIGPGSIVEPGAFIAGPSIIGANTQVRQGAYIRGNAIIGDNCVVGHATEIKNSILLGNSKAGHFAYIGDSILGEVNLGAGTKLANLKIVESEVTVMIDGNKHSTGLRKLGAILADGVETGCNSVTAPGTILSKNALLYPNTTARGYYPPGTIIKLRQNLELEEIR